MGGFIVLKTIERHPDRLLSGVICAAGWGVVDDKHRALFVEIVRAIEERRAFDPIIHWLDRNKLEGEGFKTVKNNKKLDMTRGIKIVSSQLKDSEWKSKVLEIQVNK